MDRNGKRPIRIEGDVAFVTLTQGYEAIIDAVDADAISAMNWHAYRSRNVVYAIGAVWQGGRTKLVRMHRLIMRPEAWQVVDHIDGDGLNNRRSNLRVATSQQNNFNSRVRVDNKSGVKGVFWDAARKKWQAQISVGGKSIALGRFAEISDAAAAYAEASARLHGEFGRTS